jgi:hypothetical protein
MFSVVLARAEALKATSLVENERLTLAESPDNNDNNFRIQTPDIKFRGAELHPF